MNVIKRLFCKHDWRFLRNVYGDEINAAGGKRSWWVCSKCGKRELRDELYQECDRFDCIAKGVFSYVKRKGYTAICCDECVAIDKDDLEPIDGCINIEVFKESMYEYIEWIEKASNLIFDLYAQLQNAYDAKELDGFKERVEEFRPFDDGTSDDG